MPNPADWTEDLDHRLYYGGTMPDAYREDAVLQGVELDDEATIGYEAAHPALQPLCW